MHAENQKNNLESLGGERPKIGDMQGGWATLFKVALALFPILLGTMGWMANEVVSIRLEMSAEVLTVWKEISSLKETIAALPPDSFEDRFQIFENTVINMRVEIAEMKVILSQFMANQKGRGDVPP